MSWAQTGNPTLEMKEWRGHPHGVTAAQPCWWGHLYGHWCSTGIWFLTEGIDWDFTGAWSCCSATCCLLPSCSRTIPASPQQQPRCCQKCWIFIPSVMIMMFYSIPSPLLLFWRALPLEWEISRADFQAELLSPWQQSEHVFPLISSCPTWSTAYHHQELKLEPNFT